MSKFSQKKGEKVAMVDSCATPTKEQVCPEITRETNDTRVAWMCMDAKAEMYTFRKFTHLRGGRIYTSVAIHHTVQGKEKPT